MLQENYDDCLYASRMVIDALEGVGEPWCCLVGGMAARLWGVERIVKDIDVIVLCPAVDAETLKRWLCERYPDKFFLRTPRTPGASWRTLYLQIPRTSIVLKVDLLLSTTSDVEIPSGFHRNHFIHLNNLPVAPLYLVLYHKLLGWEKRIHSLQAWECQKADQVDYHDILELCELVWEHKILPRSKSHMGRFYLEMFEFRARYFCEYYPGTLPRKCFMDIGFNV
ncbi:SubName: Full=Uncharacterized protein {ECO:0000313/EMBL:CCA73073.1} [Serendipita indica DSM 11827]|uniref:Uncharacterized protein n=1 Tax=Serendipita indica (strain DSM 11827) TaxID=1109443 RepID=G4TP26_SERID|nr:SubName: Full=Uncharacterized protein {ECO:0000313/EMBL:CCA73073.1} [Serendipita indica DSM 11827]CCA73073.1 hypothetical protein PIIN_07028 [Serendipita indica DSM 11827]